MIVCPRDSFFASYKDVCEGACEIHTVKTAKQLVLCRAERPVLDSVLKCLLPVSSYSIEHSYNPFDQILNNRILNKFNNSNRYISQLELDPYFSSVSRRRASCNRCLLLIISTRLRSTDFLAHTNEAKPAVIMMALLMDNKMYNNCKQNQIFNSKCISLIVNSISPTWPSFWD